jgi:hypothetical protein
VAGTLHPFDDGNGRISRAVGDIALARAEGASQRFYSLSAHIQRERKQYYDQLEATQRGTLDVTPWLSWFLACLLRAVQGADGMLAGVLDQAQFWQRWAGTPMNARQTLMLNHVLDGMEGMCPTPCNAPTEDFKCLRASRILATLQQHTTPCQPLSRFNQSLVQVLLQLRLGRQLGPVFGHGDAVFVHLQQLHLFATGFSAQDQADGRLFARLALVLVQPFQVQLHLAFVRSFEAAQL